MFKLYRKSKAVERAWIRKHPILWITTNLILIAVFIVILEYKDRREMRKFESQTPKQQ